MPAFFQKLLICLMITRSQSLPCKGYKHFLRCSRLFHSFHQNDKSAREDQKKLFSSTEMGEDLKIAVNLALGTVMYKLIPTDSLNK